MTFAHVRGHSHLGLLGALDCSLSLNDLLFSVLDLILHLTLVNLELNLALLFEFREHHERLIIVTLVQQ